MNLCIDCKHHGRVGESVATGVFVTVHMCDLNAQWTASKKDCVTGKRTYEHVGRVECTEKNKGGSKCQDYKKAGIFRRLFNRFR